MKKSILSILGILALAAGANAQLLYDGFNYTAGQNLVGQTNPGNSNAWTEVVAGTNNATISSGGLTYGDLTTTTGRVQLPSYSGNTQDAGISFTNSTTDVFYSFLLRMDGVGASMATSFQSLTSVVNGGTFGLGIAIRQNSSTTGTFDLGIHKRANNASAETNASLQALTTGTYFVVVNYSTVSGTGNDSMSIWLNPANASLGGGSAPSATFTSTAGSDTAVAWNQFRLFPPSQIAGYFDEVRVGTTWASVTPIPEPTTWALLVGGLTALVVFRRRRIE